MDIKVKMLAMLAVISLVAACSSTKEVANKDNCPDYMPETRCERQIQQVEKNADSVPDWMLEHPKSETAFYSTGTAVSSDLQLSIDKANLAAKRTLADRIGGELSSQLKEFVIEGGDLYDSDVITLDIEQTTKNVVAQVTVAGYNPSKMEVYPLGRMYRTYVLLEYPIGGANDILVQQIRKNRLLYAHIRSSKSFTELEAEVDSKRGRDLEDQQEFLDSVQ